MPFTLTVDHAKRRVTGVAAGVITVADIALYIAERVRQGVYSYAQLIDMRDATIALPPGESLLERAMEARRESRAGEIPRTAILATQGTASFGFARQLAVQLGFARATVEVFSTLADAETWLAGGSDRP
ncbi:MAG TPA: hypothetical protein VIK50_03275 [Gemmatimonadaceae bacterium]